MSSLALVLVILLTTNLPAYLANVEPPRRRFSFPEPGVCGVNLAERIRGGDKTALNAYPWAVLLGVRFIGDTSGRIQFICGGSLISDRFVLTAAHCFKSIVPDQHRVVIRLGEWDIESEQDCVNNLCSDAPINVEIDNYLKHENYTSDPTHNDVAVIKLPSAVNFTEFISPVCLPFAEDLQSQPETEKVFTAVGWGTTERGADKPGFYNSRYKLEIDLPGFDWKTCHELVPRLWPSEFCAGNGTERQTCQGDSGGPVVAVEDDGFWYQYGIVGYGFACGSGPFSMYVRVTSFLPWIVDSLAKLDHVETETADEEK